MWNENDTYRQVSLDLRLLSRPVGSPKQLRKQSGSADCVPAKYCTYMLRTYESHTIDSSISAHRLHGSPRLTTRHIIGSLRSAEMCTPYPTHLYRSSQRRSRPSWRRAEHLCATLGLLMYPYV